MSIAIQRIKRAIQDMPTGGMQTGKKQIKLEYSDAQRAITEIEALQAERDALAAQLVEAFGDGYYDGFLDGAKHHEKTDCNTDPQYLGDDAMRCSEIAESEKSARIGTPAKHKHLAEIRAEAVESLLPKCIYSADHKVEIITKDMVKYNAEQIRQGGVK